MRNGEVRIFGKVNYFIYLFFILLYFFIGKKKPFVKLRGNKGNSIFCHDFTLIFLVSCLFVVLNQIYYF